MRRRAALAKRKKSKTSSQWLKTLLKLQLLGAAVFLLKQTQDHWMTIAQVPRSLSTALQYPIADILATTHTAADLTESRPNTNSHLLPIPHPHQSEPEPAASPTPPMELQKPQPHDRLRLDWSNLTLRSPLAQRIKASQTTCPASPQNTRFWVHQLKRNGFGQMLHQWSQTVCNAMQTEKRVLARGSLVWMHSNCDAEFNAKRNSFSYSPLSCYFGYDHELTTDKCPLVPMPASINDTALVTNTTQVIAAQACDELLDRDNITVSEFRAASMEWLFSQVTPLVLNEAHNQLKRAFGSEGLPVNRDQLVTVHIRWGDKAREMKLKPIHSYIEAVHNLVGREKTQDPNYPLHVYVASEDVNARKQFQEEAPAHWKVHWSGPHVRNRNPAIRHNANGKKGLESLGALLLSMEANYYVLTTKSNWSRLYNELRLNVVNPRCNDCTKMIDLIPGEW